jgi:hypothetical protein
LLIASPADCRQALWVVHVVTGFAQREGRAVIEDEEAENQPCAAVGTAAFLPQDDLGSNATPDVTSLGSRERALALHGSSQG